MRTSRDKCFCCRFTPFDSQSDARGEVVIFCFKAMALATSLDDPGSMANQAAVVSDKASDKLPAKQQERQIAVAELTAMLKRSSGDAHRALRRQRKASAMSDARTRQARKQAELLPSDVLVDILKGRGVAAETIATGCVRSIKHAQSHQTTNPPQKRLRTKRPAHFFLNPKDSPHSVNGCPLMLCDDTPCPSRASPILSRPDIDRGVALDCSDFDGDMDPVDSIEDDHLWDAFCQPSRVCGEAVEPEWCDEDSLFSQPSPIAPSPS